jgi:phosphoserine phosphatase
MHVATFIAPMRSSPNFRAGVTLNDTLLRKGAGALAALGATVMGEDCLEPGTACDISFTGIDAQAAREVLEPLAHPAHIDVIVQPVGHRRKKLLIADMDSTMITIECIDELADFVGKKTEVAKVTEAAMRGELDFEKALDARVALLKGLPVTALQKCYDERVKFTAGAERLVKTMRLHGAHTVLVSGGFTFFTSRVAHHLGFHADISNTLKIEHGADGHDILSGHVGRPVINGETKRLTLLEQASDKEFTLNDCLAVGDGANDIPMIQTAGLGVAFHAKPKARAAADACIKFGDLSALLFAQGYARDSWVRAA